MIREGISKVIKNAECGGVGWLERASYCQVIIPARFRYRLWRVKSPMVEG